MLSFLKRKYHNLISDKKFSEILTGSVWALSARVGATGLGMISSIIIARFYGAKVMGIVAVMNSFLMLATIFTVLGTGTSILRLIPEHLVKYSPASAFKVYRKTQFMVIAVSLITGLIFFFGSGFIADRMFSKPHLSFYFSLAALFVVFKSLMLLNTQAVRGLRLIKVFALMQMLPSLGNLLPLLLLTFVFFNKDNPVYTYLFGVTVTAIAGWVIMECCFRKQIKPGDVVEKMPVKAILGISLPMFMTASMAFLMSQTGVIMLGMFRSEQEVGYYSVAVKLSNLTSFVLTAINSMAAPKFSELFSSGRMDELLYIAKKSAKLIFWTTTPILLCLALFGKPILRLLFGNEFIVAFPAMLFLVIGQFVNSISGSTGIFMNMTGHQNVYRNIMLISALVNIGANLLLIPQFGILGSAVAAAISTCFWNITTLFYIKMKYGRTVGYLPLS